MKRFLEKVLPSSKMRKYIFFNFLKNLFHDFFLINCVSSTQQQNLSTLSDRYGLITQASSGSLNKMVKRNLFYTIFLQSTNHVPAGV